MEQRKSYVVRAFNSVTRTLDTGLNKAVDGVTFLDKYLDIFARLILGDSTEMYPTRDNYSNFYTKKIPVLRSAETDRRIIIQ